MNPGNSLTSGTRLGAILYPPPGQTSKDARFVFPRESYNLLNIGVDCNEAIGKLSTLIDAVVNSYPNNPYHNYVGGELPNPAQAISLLNKNFEDLSNNDAIKAHRRAAIIITDGTSDEFMDDEATKERNVKTQVELDMLLKTDPNIVILAAGNGNPRDSLFRRDLLKIANNVAENVIINNDALNLAFMLIRRLVKLGIICKLRGNYIDICTPI